MMLWPCGELAVPHGTHLPAQSLFAHRDTKLVPEPLDQIT